VGFFNTFLLTNPPKKGSWFHSYNFKAGIVLKTTKMTGAAIGYFFCTFRALTFTKNHYTMKKTILYLSAILILTATSLGQSYERFGINSTKGKPQGLGEGLTAPYFEGKDQNGNTIKLTEQLRKGPVVVIFYRGYWCPVCNKHLSHFQQSLGNITEQGASVIAVTPETNESASKTVDKHGITFPVITDKNYEIMKKYGVKFSVTDQYSDKIKTALDADIAATNGDDEAVLPVPATYIIGQDGKIKKAFFDINYKNRPSTQEIARYL